MCVVIIFTPLLKAMRIIERRTNVVFLVSSHEGKVTLICEEDADDGRELLLG